MSRKYAINFAIRAGGASPTPTMRYELRMFESYFWDATLNAEVWDIAQSVVEAVGEIGGADHQRQFHDLPLVVELPQLFERTAANGGGAARDALGVQDGGLILLVEKRAALIELQCLDLLVGESDSLRRSDVRARSILAAV